MSAPALLACAAAAVCLGLPVLAAAGQLEARHRASAAADAAALAAADAASGWITAEPCEIAGAVAAEMDASVIECTVEERRGAAWVRVRLGAPLGGAEGRAHAGPPPSPGGAGHPYGPDEPGHPGSGTGVGAGWVWPAASRGLTQGFHDGFAIDLDVPLGGHLLAPNSGVVVFAGADGGPTPGACLAQPDWWRGANHTVIIRHEIAGRTLFSSHNHIEPGSPETLGIRVGSVVAPGQPVARAGMSGCTSGPHSHFTIASGPRNAFPDIDPFTVLGNGGQRADVIPLPSNER